MTRRAITDQDDKEQQNHDPGEVLGAKQGCASLSNLGRCGLDGPIAANDETTSRIGGADIADEAGVPTSGDRA